MRTSEPTMSTDTHPAPWHTHLVLQPDGVHRVLRDGTSVQVRLLTPADATVTKGAILFPRLEDPAE